MIRKSVQIVKEDPDQSACLSVLGLGFASQYTHTWVRTKFDICQDCRLLRYNPSEFLDLS